MRDRFRHRWKDHHPQGSLPGRDPVCDADTGVQRQDSLSEQLEVQRLGFGRAKSHPLALEELLRQVGLPDLRHRQLRSHPDE